MRWIYRAILLIAAILTMKRAYYFDGYTDFNVYFDYASKVKEALFGSGSVSFAVDPQNTSPFRYLPFWGLVFMPLSLFSLGTARMIFVGAQWLFYALTLRRLRTTFLLKPWQEGVILLGTLRFAIDNSKIGQISGLLLYLLFWAMPHVWNSRGRARYLALAVSLKLQPIALLLVAFFKLRFGTVLRFLVVFGALIGGSLIVGVEALESWSILSFTSLNVLDPATIGNQSLLGALLRIYPAKAHWIFLGLLAVTGILLSRIWWLLGKPAQLGWLMGLAYLPIFGALTWKNTYMLAAIPLAFFLSQGIRSVVLLALGFQLLSQGVLGESLNAWSLRVGALPWFAWLGWTIAFIQLYGKYSKRISSATRDR